MAGNGLESIYDACTDHGPCVNPRWFAHYTCETALAKTLRELAEGDTTHLDHVNPRRMGRSGRLSLRGSRLRLGHGFLNLGRLRLGGFVGRDSHI